MAPRNIRDGSKSGLCVWNITTTQKRHTCRNKYIESNKMGLTYYVAIDNVFTISFNFYAIYECFLHFKYVEIPNKNIFNRSLYI